MRKGDIVFVRGKGLISKIVRFFDKGKFSHCMIALSDSRVIEADVDTRVAVRPFEEDKYEVVEVVELKLTAQQRIDVVNASLKLVGTRYDYIQLLWYGLRRLFNLKGKNPLNNPKYVICSELVYVVLKEIGVLDDLGIEENFTNGNDLTPNELYDLVKYVSKRQAL